MTVAATSDKESIFFTWAALALHSLAMADKKRLEKVFAAVRQQGYRFVIDHTDISSMRALSLIIVLFRLQVPTGRY